MGCMCIIMMNLFECLANKYCCKHGKNISLDECNQNFNEIYKYRERYRKQ